MTRTYRMLQVLALTLAGLGAAYGCGDKVLTAKTVLTGLTLGFQTAKSVVRTIADTKRIECAKLGAVGTPAFDGCFEKTRKMVEATDKIWPAADQLLVTGAGAIRAYEQKTSGVSVDFVTPLKAGVCLLTELSVWLPEKYRKKVEVFLALAASYTCDAPSSRIDSPERQKRLMVAMVALLRDLGARG